MGVHGFRGLHAHLARSTAAVTAALMMTTARMTFFFDQPRPLVWEALQSGCPLASRSVHALSPFRISRASTTCDLPVVTREPVTSRLSPFLISNFLSVRNAAGPSWI